MVNGEIAKGFHQQWHFTKKIMATIDNKHAESRTKMLKKTENLHI
jgi:hypothetical protein